MHREAIITRDGSSSITIPEMGVTYHSIYGAMQESKHVFIKNGLEYTFDIFSRENQINILEVGFGTGLNAYLTALRNMEAGRQINYTAIDLHPLELELVQALNYKSLSGEKSNHEIFQHLHSSPWEVRCQISERFSIIKKKVSLIEYLPEVKFHLIYFDAFAPKAQPELWTADIFIRLYNSMNSNGSLVTYCSKGEVRRAMATAGFRVEKLQGPLGKREMLRASVIS